MRRLAIALILVAAPISGANAHPHVMVEGNLEIVRDGSGNVSELRHVWRFDELFSSDVLLNYDDDADGTLNAEELAEVGSTVGNSIKEYDYYTQVRLDGTEVEFSDPDRVMVDYMDGQVLIFFALKLKESLAVNGRKFQVAVSDPTYYVAMELADETAVQISGDGTACTSEILRPDFDKLYAQNQKTLSEQFFSDSEGSALGDEWLTWVNIQCQ
ncbi:MAG: DUF1007 family protein [Rhizobiaceae bacterium]